MEGSGTDAAWQSCLGNRAVKGKAGDVKGLDAEAESSLGMGGWEVSQQKANCSNIIQLLPATMVIFRMWL